MNEQAIQDALRVYVTIDEPPVRLRSDQVVRAGRRSRAVHRLGYAGGVVALSGMVAVGGHVAGGLFGSTANQPGSPTWTYDPTVCASIPSAAAIVPTENAPAPAQMNGSNQLADRMSCYLRTAVPAAMPGATFADNPARGTPYLVAGPGMFEGEGFAATALVTMAAGTGLLLFQATHETISTDTWTSRCNGPDAKGECRTGPHGERIQIMDFGPDSAGVWVRTVMVYSGQTTILAGAHNAPESDNSRPTMTEPPLTVEQLIALACDPALVLFP
jgi:hypothetical protein